MNFSSRHFSTKYCQTIHLYRLGLVRTRLPEKGYIPNSTEVIGIHLLEITELPSFRLRARERAPPVLVLMKCKQLLAKCAGSALVSGGTGPLALQLTENVMVLLTASFERWSR